MSGLDNGRVGRRDLLLALAGAATVSLLPRTARASLVCADDPVTSSKACAIGVSTRDLAGVYAAQEHSMWCWAACLHMLFRYYGYGISQERVVSEGWGQVIDLPAFREQIIAATNRSWRADDGRSFRSFGQYFDVTLPEVAEDLRDGRPLLLMTIHHAMLLTSLYVERDALGNERVARVAVQDPWPGNGARDLTAQEWSEASLLRVAVFDAAGQKLSRPPAPCRQETVPCAHPSHEQGDLAPCRHACRAPDGRTVACHEGDLAPCQHTCATPLGPGACHQGDRLPCRHAAHPAGHPVIVCE